MTLSPTESVIFSLYRKAETASLRSVPLERLFFLSKELFLFLAQLSNQPNHKATKEYHKAAKKCHKAEQNQYDADNGKLCSQRRKRSVQKRKYEQSPA